MIEFRDNFTRENDLGWDLIVHINEGGCGGGRRPVQRTGRTGAHATS